jgi:hypothetical protein
MMIDEIQTNGLQTIFDENKQISSPVRKDLGEKLVKALEKNEIIHQAICSKISRLMAYDSTPTTLELLTPLTFKLEGIQAMFFTFKVE